MATLTQLRSKMRSWLAKDSIQLPDDVATDMINIARREVQSAARWSACEQTNTTTTTTTGSATISLPSGTQFVYWIKYQDADGDWHTLDQMLLGSMIDEYGHETENAEPQAWALWAQAAQLQAPADAAYTLEIRFYGTLADLSADADSDWFTENAWDMILYRALMEASAFGFEDERAPIWQAAYQAAFDRCTIRDAQTYISAASPLQVEEP